MAPATGNWPLPGSATGTPAELPGGLQHGLELARLGQGGGERGALGQPQVHHEFVAVGGREEVLVDEAEARDAAGERGQGQDESRRQSHAGGGLELFNELMDTLRLNVVSFFNSPMPAQPMGWFKQEITDASQMQGLKYRTVGLAADVLLEMGMSVVQLPGGEIQPAMKSGLIDAAEFNNPTSDKDFGMQDVAKNYYLASFHQSQESFEIIFNKKKYASLSKEHQAILRYASEAASSDMSWKAQDRYSADLIALQKEYGVKVHRTPNEIMKAQLVAWDKVLPKFMEDPYFAKVVESQKAAGPLF